MTSQKPQRRLPLAAAVCAALLFTLPGCAQTAAVTAPVNVNDPAKVEKNATTGIAKLTLTERGLERLELKTDTVKAGTGTDVLLPYASLLYDANGKTWVYTNPAPGYTSASPSPFRRWKPGSSRPLPVPRPEALLSP